jgi:putative flippase GtrA
MDIMTRLVNRKELIFYIIVGVFATAMDWITFTISVKWLNLHYQLALILALFIGSLTNYSSNKIFTFKCHSRQYGSQISLFALISIFTLFCSMGMMGLFIKIFGIHKVLARMLTTVLMLLPNYLLHKHITFSKKVFVSG